MNEIILSQAVRYNLYGEINEFGGYDTFIEKLSFYNERDKINLHINCVGGNIDVGMAIVNAIQSTKARVTCIVEYPSFSMGALIALAGDGLIMRSNTFLMFHNYSTGAYGKGAEITQSITSYDEYLNRLFSQICSPFLNKNEIEKLRRDQDIYIYDTDPTLKQRIKRHFV